jgi:hypothetical protein
MKRRTRIAAFVTVLLTPSLGMAAWYAATKASDKDNDLSELLGNYGYVELSPPSRLYGPGTIATVETLPTGALRLHLACKLGEDVLASLWQKSMTLDRRMVTNIEQQFDAEANALNVATARATGKRIRDINVSLLDMNILTMPYENLLEVRSRYMTGNCQEAIRWNLRHGAEVCQTEEVLQADVVYTFGFQDGLRSDEKLELAEQFAGSVGIGDHVSEANEVRGDDLYLGVKVRFSDCFKFAEGGQDLVAAGL